MGLILREYQEKAIEALYRFLADRDDNPCLVIPTGGGKTPILARICADAVQKWGGRVIVLAHVKELLEQAYSHLERDAMGAFAVGIYSAGLGSRDTKYLVTIAGIQSAYRNVRDFPPVNLIIVDEAHRIPPDGEGMYRTFLAEMKDKNPDVRMIGLTATPYRTSTGAICANENLLNAICFEIGVRELINQGYLSPLVTRGGTVDTDFSGLDVKRGEFDQNQLETLMSEDVKVATALSDILHRAKDRKKILIFASGVSHGRKIAEFLRPEPDAGSVGEIYGETPADERAELVRRFRDGDLRILINRDVLTLGFDAPNVDCVALMRATMSPGLYYQMVGRGFRIAGGKKDCLVLDFGGNVIRHGPVDVLAPDEKTPSSGDGEAPAKKCPGCCLIVPTATATCPECGYEFPKKPPGSNLDTAASEANVLSKDRVEDVPVLTVEYSLHVKRKEDGSESRTLRVDYLISDVGIQVSEWVCLQHRGFARDKAEGWWTRRAGPGPIPATIDEALDQADRLAKPTALRVNFGGRFPSILGYKFVDSLANK